MENNTNREIPEIPFDPKLDITTQEMEAALKKIKPCKTSDNIVIEMITALGKTEIEIMLCNKIWHSCN